MDIAQLKGVEASSSAQCLSLVLSDPLAVYGTEYKVLRSQGPGSFVPCVRSRLNGHDRLTYLTRPYVSLNEYCAGQTPEDVARLLATGVESLLLLRDNGFLSLQNATFAADTLFVDRAAGRLLLIYVPMARSTSGGDLETARRAFRTCAEVLGPLCGATSLLRGFEGTQAYRDGDLVALMALLGGPVSPAPAGARRASSSNGSEVDRGAASKRDRQSARPGLTADPVGQTWTLTAASSSHERYEVPTEGGVIGKSPSRASIVVSLSPAISRAHCRITPNNGLLTIEDLGSANGTFVNGARVAKGAPVELREGERLRLADVQFTVRKG